ncbi:PIN2/TERF1-interacting telomerase inhibitor 1 [Cololabis saira]|uniref:PIN2/TERF1-interacting telomerase inhibitor 1 n=1 Tax=Cololabis saira TaxID=129043 RepID=UPI002AD502E5|nr:PIN2/TERF1-interacting telomerase inhibitor 1 [Cololabis saira]
MSMLAEPRRKQKWSVDPRNSAWSKDESKFGQKMLERMGWSKGKGLGRTEQGSTDHIKVKVKNNNYGLGTNASQEDNWIAHQDDFNELLAQLNSHHSQNTGSEAHPEEKEGFSLEEKSKTSKKRVHYMKFTKGKDLSSRSETDLNCIFGKRGRPIKEQEQESSSSDSQGETEENGTPAAPVLDTESITKTVKSSLNMQEYFAQRMAQLKKGRGAQSTAASPAEASTSPGPPEEPCSVHSESNDTEEPKKKRKKKKKSKKPAEEVEEEECSTPVVVVEEQENPEQEKCSRKKKKRKMAENHCDANENSSPTDVLEVNCEQVAPSKKKKLKKNRGEILNGHDLAEDETAELEVVPNTNVSEQEDGVVTKDKDEPREKKCKKKKKKRKNQD